MYWWNGGWYKSYQYKIHLLIQFTHTWLQVQQHKIGALVKLPKNKFPCIDKYSVHYCVVLNACAIYGRGYMGVVTLVKSCEHG